MRRTILHIDFNSYFASVEQQKDPKLRGKPVGVIKAEGRTVIIAASAEAKQRGVRTGTLVWQAKRLCPEIVLVPADFDSYDQMTRRFAQICRRFSNTVELFSLDEVFLDATETAHLFGSPARFAGAPARRDGEASRPKNLALYLKKVIKQDLGEYMKVSIGIAKNKLLAKLASDMEKPDGLVEISDENQDVYLGKANFEQICGIGRRLEERLKEIGITQLLQIRRVPTDYLRASFGPHWSKELVRMAWGRDESPVAPPRDLPLPKSVSRTYTLFREIDNPDEILAVIRNLVEEAAEKLRRARMAGRQFGLMIRGGVRWAGPRYHFLDTLGLESSLTSSSPPSKSESNVLPGSSSIVSKMTSSGQPPETPLFITRKCYTNDPQVVFNELKRLFITRKWSGSVRFLGVWIGLLAEEGATADCFLPEVKRRRLILAAQDEINGRFGHYTVFPASLLRTQLIYPEVNGYLGDERIRRRIEGIEG